MSGNKQDQGRKTRGRGVERGGGGRGVKNKTEGKRRKAGEIKTLYLQATEASNRTKRTINNKTEKKEKKESIIGQGYTQSDGRPQCQTRAR